jgi:hypothetical protein
MRILEKLLIRRHDHPQFSSLPPRVRKRLGHACQELAEAEAEMARLIGLPKPPRLLLVDEEQASIIFPEEREASAGAD